MLQGAMLVWFILTGLSVIFVVWDSITNGVTSWVQRLAWILVTVYSGPVGAFLYVLACRRPFPGGHDRYTAATWKQGLNSEMHCLAGDATGIVVAAAIVPVFDLANGWDALIEYGAGFFFGLFIFQALMMVAMYAGNYLLAVRKTFFAETVSMNLVMTGMIPVMLFLAHLWPDSENALEPAFWFRMSIATIAGGIIAFPINRWLVANHLKHGCMTLPGADGPAPGLGHHSPETGGMAMPGHTAHAAAAGHGGMGTMPPPSSAGEQGAGHAHGDMAMQELPLGVALGWIIATSAVLLAAVWVTAQWVPLRFDGAWWNEGKYIRNYTFPSNRGFADDRFWTGQRGNADEERVLGYGAPWERLDVLERGARARPRCDRTFPGRSARRRGALAG